jgi:phage baseplate assembly protein V
MNFFRDGNGNFPQGNAVWGVVAGIVTNNQDPDNLGRVKVKIPYLTGSEESNWARVASLMAGKERGAFFLPEVGDEVLLAFECGDITHPYVIGALWNGVDKPPGTNSDGQNDLRFLKSRSGHLIRLDDKDGAEKIEIIDKTGKNTITIDTKANTIRIAAEQDIEITASNGKIVLSARDLEFKSTASTKVEASAAMNLKATGKMTVKRAMVEIN